MKVGYARTSTVEQKAGFEAQIRDLTAAGCEEIFKEQLSSVDAKRAQFDAAMSFIRKGDMLVVTKIDRLARSVANLVDIEQRLNAKGASLQVLDPGMDTSSSMGRLMFNVIASIAQFEREIMLERQKEGVAKGKADGKYRGRAPTARAKREEILALITADELNITEIAKVVGVNRRSIYRILKDVEAGLPIPDITSWKKLNGAKK
jgi:DNA invertase Pin-like site-specific DNA recombinase